MTIVRAWLALLICTCVWVPTVEAQYPTRPIRFIGYRGRRDHGFFDWVFRISGCIPISPRQPTDGFKRAVRALRAGRHVRTSLNM